MLIHDSGSGLFRFTAASGLGVNRIGQPADPALDLEPLDVVGPTFGENLVDGQFVAASLKKLLEPGLGILEIVRIGQRSLAPIDQVVDDAPCLLETAIEENRSKDRLDGIGKDRFTQESTAFPFPHAEAKVLPDIELSRQLGQGAVADQARSQATQITFGGFGTAFEEQLGDHEIQQAVAEELKALVMARAEAAVGQGLLQQPRIREPIVDAGDTIDRSHH